MKIFQRNTKNYQFEWQTNSKEFYNAELSAIHHCLKDILASKLTNKNFLIQSDSLSSLLSIQNIFTDHPIVQNIHKILYDLQNLNFIIQFAYVPSHIGIHGNEIVDTLAKSAINPSPFTTLCTDDIKFLITQQIYSS